MRTALILFVAICLSSPGAAPVLVQESHNDYERFYAWFPDVEYSFFGFHSPQELRQNRLATEFPEQFDQHGHGLLWPFALADFDYVYTGTVRDERRSAEAIAYMNKLRMDRRAQGVSTEITRDERLELMVRFSPGLTTSIAVFSCAELPLLLESAVKSGLMQPTGERIGKVSVFSCSPVGAPVTIKAWYYSPEPDLLIAAGTLELLKAMARAGEGSGPGLLNGEYGGDIKDYICDAPTWFVQPLNMAVSRVAEKEREQDLPERYREMREEQMKRVPLALITEILVTDDEVITRQEWVFASGEYAAQRMNQMKQIDQGIISFASSDIPTAVTAYQREHDARTIVRIEGNRYIREQIRTIADLEQYRQLRNSNREYFENLEKESKRRTYGEQKEQQ